MDSVAGRFAFRAVNLVRCFLPKRCHPDTHIHNKRSPGVISAANLCWSSESLCVQLWARPLSVIGQVLLFRRPCMERRDFFKNNNIFTQVQRLMWGCAGRAPSANNPSVIWGVLPVDPLYLWSNCRKDPGLFWIPRLSESSLPRKHKWEVVTGNAARH